MRGQVVCLLASAAMLAGPVGCGSSDDETAEQEIGLEDGEEGDEEFENDAPLNNIENDNLAENEFLNEAEGEDENFNNFENENGEFVGDNNFANNEFENGDGFENFNNADNGLNNFENEEFAQNGGDELDELINDSAADTFSETEENVELANNAGADPFAEEATTDLNGETVDPFAADAGADPFAAEEDPFAANAAEPFAANAAEDLFAVDAGTDPVVSADEAVAPVETGVATALPAQGMVPEDGARLAYHIQVGDTLAIISQKIFGNAGSWRTLAQENNLSNPNLIYAGDVLYYTLSGQSRGFAERYESSPRESVSVQAGDTLSSIAQRIYGTQAAWRTLWKENPQLTNPDVIEVGMVLSYRSPSAVVDLNTTDLTEEFLVADLFE